MVEQDVVDEMNIVVTLHWGVVAEVTCACYVGPADDADAAGKCPTRLRHLPPESSSPDRHRHPERTWLHRTHYCPLVARAEDHPLARTM